MTNEPDSGRSWTWVRRESVDERSALDAFCDAVGPPVVSNTTPASPPAMDSIAVVTWNVGTTHGDLGRFVDSLQAGALTEAPVRRFVLILQEVVRHGPAVPESVPQWAAMPERIGSPDRLPNSDIVSFARSRGLSLAYAPSMRDGKPEDGGPAVDRGNAILSTLPLDSVVFVELPWERQRRVAVAANVRGSSSDGTPWTLRVVAVHLEHRSRIGRIYRSLGSGRAWQIDELLDQLEQSPVPTAMGGDFNTWLHGAGSEAVNRVRQRFTSLQATPERRTLPLPSIVPDLRLDYFFFRVPDRWRVGYDVHPDAFGSDHRPLLGWVRFGDPVADPPEADGPAAW